MSVDVTIPPAANTDDNHHVWWVDTIADPAAPTVDEINAGTVIGCYLTVDGFNLTVTEAAVVDERLCSSQTYQGKGRTTYALTVKYVENPAVPASDEAATTLVPGSTGYFVERRGYASDLAVAADQLVNVIPAELGEYQPQPREANSKFKILQNAFVNGPVHIRAEVASGA